MKKIAQILAVAIITLSFWLTPAIASAQSICPSGGSFSNLCNLKVDKAGGIVGAVVQLLLIIAIVVSLLFLIWGGIRYISSGGDKGKVDQARSTLTAAIIGLVIALLAFFIVNVVLYMVTGKGLTTLQIPTLLQ